MNQCHSVNAATDIGWCCLTEADLEMLSYTYHLNVTVPLLLTGSNVAAPTVCQPREYNRLKRPHRLHITVSLSDSLREEPKGLL